MMKRKARIKRISWKNIPIVWEEVTIKYGVFKQ